MGLWVVRWLVDFDYWRFCLVVCFDALVGCYMLLLFFVVRASLLLFVFAVAWLVVVGLIVAGFVLVCLGVGL